MLLLEIFQAGKNWKWEFRGSEEAFASFIVGDVEYLWSARALNKRSPNDWVVAFQVREKGDWDKTFGMTGTGNSAEVMSTVVDITRSFLQEYGDRVLEIKFSSAEDSRTSLYARMVKRLLPGWNMHSKKTADETDFYLTNPRAYELMNTKLNELFDPNSGFEIEWDYRFGPKEMHGRAHDSRGNYIDIKFIPVRDNITEVEFSKNDSFETTGGGDANAIFATVLEAFREYLRGYQPKIFIFSAKGGSRAKLYQRMVQRFAPQIGYKQFDINKLNPVTRDTIAASGSNVIVLRKATV